MKGLVSTIAIRPQNEAMRDVSKGKQYEIIVPRSTVYIEPKAVLVDKNIDKDSEEVVRGFIDFLWSRQAQEAFARNYYRVRDKEIMGEYPDRYQRVELPFTMDYLGGWEEATPTVIIQIWRQLPREIK